MPLRFLFLAFIISFSAQAQISVSYSEKQDKTILFYKVKGIDSVKIPGKWDEDVRDLTKAFYLKKDDKHIAFRIDPKKKKYATDCLKSYVSDKTKSLKSWKYDLLSTDGSTYQLYKVTSERHPDFNQVAILACRGEYTYNIIAYGPADDAAKSQFLIDLFQQITP
ncbi:MAG: hypothetical protein EOO50_06705 [Flavobacterium sp.]|uniref:hypothetical protein n=1 Tax=Flavobacterium sp. TaxID=239 RepID=UPI001201BE15|nr:hypothetical protein [Flavobacterium sp.]RZJ67207.1 MAG: hypothetical protein EOO50_06705 [Flavobacterium sp.]